MRNKPNGNIIGKLLKGTIVYGQEISESWFQILWGGKSYNKAFISKNYLEPPIPDKTSIRNRAINIAISMANKGYNAAMLNLTAAQWCVQYISCLLKAAGCKKYPDLTKQAKVSSIEKCFDQIATIRQPKIGDCIIYSSPKHKYAHVGLVIQVSKDNIETIEGNLNNTIKRREPFNYKQKLNDFTIKGFVSPPYI